MSVMEWTVEQIGRTNLPGGEIVTDASAQVWETVWAVRRFKRPVWAIDVAQARGISLATAERHLRTATQHEYLTRTVMPNGRFLYQ